MTPTEFTHARITAILRYPNGWGTPHAVELQILLLVEMEHVCSSVPQSDIDGTNARYFQFIARALTSGSPQPLYVRLGMHDDCNNTEFTRILNEFVESERTLFRI